jgi:asparagine synthase (glutamine-hydrolysing)
MVFREGSNMPTFKEYWELPVIKEEDKVDPGEDIVIKETTKLLNQSIAYRMISDVPTGAYLSGGLDSSLIVALMARQSSKPINTFSVGFKEDGFNEFEFSRQVAEEYATNHHEVVLSVSEYLDATQDVIRFKDAPVAVPFEVSGYLLSKELKKYITVILAGEGSDELFGGYGRIFRSGDDFIAMRKLQDETYLLGNKREALKKNLIKKYGRLDFATAQEFFLFQYPYFTGKDREAIIHADFLTSHAVDPLHQAEFTRLFDKVCDLHPTQQFIYVFEHIHLSGLLHRLDTSAMAQSIEAREPFVDYRLIEYISSLPLKYKLRWRSTADKEEASVLNSDQVSEVHDISKYLLREVGKKYLPQNIVERKKLGPPAPLNAWLTGEVKQKIKERLLSPHAKTRQLFNDEGLASWLEEGQHDNKYGLRIWMLWNLELWMQEYAVQV